MYNGINPIAVHLAVTSPNRVNIGNVGLRCTTVLCFHCSRSILTVNRRANSPGGTDWLLSFDLLESSHPTGGS
jgi:hypothetical protein